MKTDPTPTQLRPGGPIPLADSLARTLQEEHDALVRLGALFDAHREALRAPRQDQLEEATNQTNDLVGTLGRMRQARERQMRLLGRVLRVEAEPATLPPLAEALRAHPGGDAAADGLLALRAAIRTAAEDAQRRCDDLAFALGYALDLGRELLQSMQGVDPAAASSRVYTQKGAATQHTGPRSFLNTIG